MKLKTVLYIVVTLVFLSVISNHFWLDTKLINYFVYSKNWFSWSLLNTWDIKDVTYLNKLEELKTQLFNNYQYYSKNMDSICSTTIREAKSSLSNSSLSYNINYESVYNNLDLLPIVNCNIYNNTNINSITLEVNYKSLVNSKVVNTKIQQWLQDYINKWYQISIIVKVEDYNIFNKGTINIVSFFGLTSIKYISFIVTTDVKPSTESLDSLKLTWQWIINWYKKYYPKTPIIFSIDSKYTNYDTYIEDKLSSLRNWIKVPEIVTLWVEPFKQTQQVVMFRDDLENVLEWTTISEKTQSLLEILDRYIKESQNLNIQLYFDFNISKKFVDQIDWVVIQTNIFKYKDSNILLILPNSQWLKDINQTKYKDEVDRIAKSYSWVLTEQDIKFLVYKYKSEYYQQKYDEQNSK